MKKTALLLFIATISWQLQAQSNPLLGKWKVIKTKSAYVDVTLSQKETMQAYGVIVTFLPNEILVQKNEYFRCTMTNKRPQYKLKIVDPLKYFKDRKLIKMLECSTKRIKIMYTGLGVPFEEIIFANDNLISIAADENTYFLERIR